MAHNGEPIQFSLQLSSLDVLMQEVIDEENSTVKILMVQPPNLAISLLSYSGYYCYRCSVYGLGTLKVGPGSAGIKKRYKQTWMI